MTYLPETPVNDPPPGEGTVVWQVLDIHDGRTGGLFLDKEKALKFVQSRSEPTDWFLDGWRINDDG